MRRVTEQGATSLAPLLDRPAVVDAGFDDRCRVRPTDHVGNRSMPVREPTQQLGFRAVRVVICKLGLVCSTPPGGAATTEWNKADANTQAKRLGQRSTNALIANSAPALIAAINRFSVVNKLRANPGTNSISTDQSVAECGATAGKMSGYSIAGLFETDELFAEMNAVRRKSREECLLQISIIEDLSSCSLR